MSYKSIDRPGPAEFQTRLHECPTGCLEWMGTRNKLGYGTLHVNGGRAWLAHRWAWTLQRGAIPDGLLVLHSCDNPPCCNVNHLWLGTNADNKHDSMRKGRHAWTSFAGELNWNSKLTAAQVLAIRSDVRVQRIIAADYGVSQSLVSVIKKRKKWAHVIARADLADGTRP